MRIMASLGLGLLIASGASSLAKDLPRDAPPRSVTGCEWAGPGFIKVEGSATCIKVSGAVRAEYATSSKGGAFTTTSH